MSEMHSQISPETVRLYRELGLLVLTPDEAQTLICTAIQANPHRQPAFVARRAVDLMRGTRK